MVSMCRFIHFYLFLNSKTKFSSDLFCFFLLFLKQKADTENVPPCFFTMYVIFFSIGFQKIFQKTREFLKIFRKKYHQVKKTKIYEKIFFIWKRVSIYTGQKIFRILNTISLAPVSSIFNSIDKKKTPPLCCKNFKISDNFLLISFELIDKRKRIKDTNVVVLLKSVFRNFIILIFQKKRIIKMPKLNFFGSVRNPDGKKKTIIFKTPLIGKNILKKNSPRQISNISGIAGGQSFFRYMSLKFNANQNQKKIPKYQVLHRARFSMLKKHVLDKKKKKNFTKNFNFKELLKTSYMLYLDYFSLSKLISKNLIKITPKYCYFYNMHDLSNTVYFLQILYSSDTHTTLAYVLEKQINESNYTLNFLLLNKRFFLAFFQNTIKRNSLKIKSPSYALFFWKLFKIEYLFLWIMSHLTFLFSIFLVNYKNSIKTGFALLFLFGCFFHLLASKKLYLFFNNIYLTKKYN